MNNFNSSRQSRPRLALRALVVFTLVVAVFQRSGNAETAAEAHVYDIVVYGDSSGAVTAAISAKRQGRSVILINPTHFLGGMSASGLGATDFLGRRDTFGGIASDFYDEIAKHYGEKFVRSFEPHVGQAVFKKMTDEAGIPVVFNAKLNRESGVEMDGQRIVSITTLDGQTYGGKMFIDATYVGDLMAAAGVTYTVGREPEEQYGESLAGVRQQGREQLVTLRAVVGASGFEQGDGFGDGAALGHGLAVGDRFNQRHHRVGEPFDRLRANGGGFRSG